MQTRTLLTLLLAVCNVCALPKPQQQSSTSSISTSSETATAGASSSATAASSTIPGAFTPASVSSSTPSTSASSSVDSEVDGSAYYPSEPGRSYDDDPNAAQSTVDSTGGNDGSSTTFMSMSMPAQIGIIVAVVFCAIAMFVGSVLYYFHRRRQWEKEVQRRSQLIISKSKPTPKNMSEESLAQRGSTTTTISAAGAKSEFDTEPRKPDSVWKKWMPRL